MHIFLNGIIHYYGGFEVQILNQYIISCQCICMGKFVMESKELRVSWEM